VAICWGSLKSEGLTRQEGTREWNILHKIGIDYFYALPNIKSLIQPKGILSWERREYKILIILNRGKRPLRRHKWRWEDETKINADET
jgi:hypothetical protein